MPDFSQPVEFSFVVIVIATMLVVSAVAIVLVKLKKVDG